MVRYLLGLLLLVVLAPAAGVLAQDTVNVSQTAASVPASYQISDFNFEYQGWNNCGPATLTTALTHFGYSDTQSRAAQWLKPNNEDKNVTPREMVAFINSQVPEVPVFSLYRYGGTLDLLKLLISSDFPVIIEKGYDPPPHDKGWMGHYLLVAGYDDTAQVFKTYDSYLGPNQEYTYDYLDEHWQHFNRVFIVPYESGREPELLELLGTDADPQQNALNALETARTEATLNPNNPFAWFNIGTSYVALADTYQEQAYEYAAVAYDEARKHDLPWRMMWYQFGPLEAYNAVGRYEDTLTLTRANLNDGGGQWVEETFYYAGVAREGMGETAPALENYKQAAFLNPNYTAAVEARNRLLGTSS